MILNGSVADFSLEALRTSSTITENSAEATGSSVACDNYRVDLGGAVFGQCVCGRPKAEHASSAFGRGKPAGGGGGGGRKASSLASRFGGS